ncbi:MAG TPA: hemolysin D [Cyanobacteria bacterium UBA8803]|nr:hemolysin D [Cyanobacteria bacterium UBA9273]HBL58078.1 hemolysin D [Cyanobacteria bacterium UBA8803]
MNQRNGSNSNQSITLRSPNQPGDASSPNNGKVTAPSQASDRFDQPVILQQSPVWSRAIVWTIVGVTTATLIWAFVAKIEEAIPAQGKLEPQGAVKEVQAPVGGVVKDIDIKEGERVEKDDRLLTFDQTAAQAQFESLQRIRQALVQENQFYYAQMNGAAGSAAGDRILQLPPEIESLTENRASLVAESKLYQAQLNQMRGKPTGGIGLTQEQQDRFRASQSELRSRVAAAQLEVEQLTKQLSQTTVQLVNARNILSVNQEITASLDPLVREGGFARLQFLRQQQETNTRQTDVIRLTQEEERLKLAIAQAQEKLQNTIAFSEADVRTKLADNEKKISEINSQLNKIIVENNKKIREIDSQLSETKLTLNYQELRSPVGGTVFDLQAKGPGFVARSSEPILKIVPDEGLVAKVFITNRDIGFVKEGMNVDVRVDSFPYSEFGDIKGKVMRIGSDALPPDEIYPFYRFPTEIRIDKQSISINSREVPLQSGMSVSANIKVRKRTVMSIFSDLFVKKIDSLKNVR